MTTIIDLSGVYARIAATAQNADIARLLAALRAEPEPRHPHITQALDAYANEARERGLEDHQ
jgi:hypothetical protein